MITGSADEFYAYSHYFKWWREEKAKQLVRRAEREAALVRAAPEPAPDAFAPSPAVKGSQNNRD
jgi:hypothetical protein